MAVIALAIPIACAWFALLRVVPGRVFRAGIAAATAIAAASVITIVLMVLTSRVDSPFATIDAALWISALAAAWWRFGRSESSLVGGAAPKATLPPWVLLVAGALCTVALVRSGTAAHGEWDAWAIWNLRARFLLRARDWTEGFAPELSWSHPDYPLLLPASVARLWAWHGSEPTWAPLLLAAVFGGATLCVVVGAAGVANPRARVTAGLLLIGSPWIWQVPTQLADVPLGLFFCTCVALACLGWRKQNDTLLALAGFAASMGAWTKNEGIVFALAFAAVCGVAGRRMLPWLVGAVPGFVLLIWFKLTVAPPSDLAQPVASILDNLVDPTRHTVVLHALPGAAGWSWIPPVVLFSYYATTVRKTADARIAIAVMIVMLAGYYSVYVTTPHPQVWHVETSFARLLAQLWPVAVFAATGAATDRAVTQASEPLRD